MKNTELLNLLGQRIKKLRLERGLTQDELGFICNNHGEQIGRIERGELNVTISTLHMISEGLKVDIKEFFND